ncbi:hypothetical protein CKO51_06950 [Rhodopirellula sp. SM50]|nr:hypothetical protein CKO51_06950 [Rhodopirellula sp. SM50]
MKAASVRGHRSINATRRPPGRAAGASQPSPAQLSPIGKVCQDSLIRRTVNVENACTGRGVGKFPRGNGADQRRQSIDLMQHLESS